MSPRDIRDASGGGAEVNASDTVSFADSLIQTTGNWSTAFSSTRYLEWDYNSPLATGISVSSMTFDFRMIPNTSADTACYYFEVRRASTNALLGAHGSSGSPVACITGSTYSTTSTSIAAEVTSTDIADDLRIRVYGKESTGKPMKIDMAVVSGSTAYQSFTLYERVYNDQSSGTASVTDWSLATAGDGFQYVSAANWSSSFASTRYLKFTFPAYVPSGASVTNVTLTHAYRPNSSGSTTCYYFEVYNGATLVETHGSSSSPVSCNSSNTTWVTDTITLTGVTTDTMANNLVIKLYVKDSGAKRSQHDLLKASITYQLN